MSCLTPTQFSFVRMYYYCNNQSIKSLIQYPIIHWITSLVFSLFILLSIFLEHTCENYLSSKIYLLWLFFTQGSFSNDIIISIKGIHMYNSMLSHRHSMTCMRRWSNRFPPWSLFHMSYLALRTWQNFVLEPYWHHIL